MTGEKKEATIIVKVTLAIKAMAVKKAAHERRSVANYIAWLIEQDAKRK